VRGRHLIAAAVGAAALFGLAGCGSSGPSVGVARVAGSGTAAGASGSAAGSTGAVATKIVRYQGLEFQVTADWPVYDLAADPTRCVRFDVHAV